MGDMYQNQTILPDSNSRVGEECRERRQRRRETQRRRLHSVEPTVEPVVEPVVEPEEEVIVMPTPTYGVLSIAGRMRTMEDYVCIKTELCRPEIARGMPVHFFGVYDGHGGSHVAKLCKENLHQFLTEELTRAPTPNPAPTPTRTRTDPGTGTSASTSSSNNIYTDTATSNTTPTPNRSLQRALRDLERVSNIPSLTTSRNTKWRAMIKKAFERMDEVALATCACGGPVIEVGQGENGQGPTCNCHPVVVSLTGSTAVVAIVTNQHIIVANCGDSRAVLRRGNLTYPLSFDHKPNRPDELARVEAAGGRIIYLQGPRVQGILAMSRAIGDKFLKPLVISEPEITITRRDPDDECLILASDGLWDVIPNDIAGNVALACLQDRNRPTPGDVTGEEETSPSLSSEAAALLTRLALGRNSCDNISVIVVDLKSRQRV